MAFQRARHHWRRRPAHALAIALAITAASLCGAGGASAENPIGVRPRVAVWVPCEGSLRVLDDPARIARLVEDAKALGATDLFVQVYRGGRAWFDSAIADATPHRTAREKSGVDPLAALLDAAHARGLRVHAWMNALSLSENRNATLLARLGRDAVQTDQRGRSVLDYPNLEVPPPDASWYRMGTRQVWLDPAVPTVGETLAAITTELATRYPGLDGIHLDYIRFPDVLPFSPGSRFGVGLDFGHGTVSRARFERETGLRPPSAESLANADRWDAWRRERVSEIVSRVAGAARAVRPTIEVSAAVIAYADRAYLSLFQDWRGWLDAKRIDFAVAMAYTTDDPLLRQIAAGAIGGVGGDRVWIGLGSWLFASDPARARAQRDAMLALKPAGLSLFSYDALAEAPALRDALAPAPVPVPVPVPPPVPAAP